MTKELEKELYFEELETVEDLIDWKDLGTGVGFGFVVGLIIYGAIAPDCEEENSNEGKAVF